MKPDPNNANTHSQRSIEAIARSLLRFGFRKPMIADYQGVVRAGNGTLEAVLWIAAQNTDSPEDEALRSRAQEVGVLRSNAKGKLVPWVRCEISALKGFEATAFALADNQTARISSLDWEKVAQHLKEIDAAGAPIDTLGFAPFEIEPLLAAEWRKPSIEPLPGQENTSNNKKLESIQLSAEDYQVVCRILEKYRAQNEIQGVTDGTLLRMLCESWDGRE